MYHIIEHIKELVTKEDRAELQRCKDFNEYAKQRIFECLTEVGPVSDTEHADIFVKVDLLDDSAASKVTPDFSREEAFRFFSDTYSSTPQGV